MDVVPASSSPWPQVPGGHIAVASITVGLIQEAADDLQRLRTRTRLSITDLLNRAITFYEFLDAQTREGHDLIVRNNGTGEAHLVRFG